MYGKEAHKEVRKHKKIPKGFEQGCSFLNARHQMKQVRFKHLFPLVSILCILRLFSNNCWAWIELTLTEEVYYSVKDIIPCLKMTLEWQQ